MDNKTKHKNKKHFSRYCMQYFSREEVLVEHRKVCLNINGKQSLKSRNGLIRFNNLSEKLAAPFKIYAGF